MSTVINISSLDYLVSILVSLNLNLAHTLYLFPKSSVTHLTTWSKIFPWVFIFSITFKVKSGLFSNDDVVHLSQPGLCLLFLLHLPNEILWENLVVPLIQHACFYLCCIYTNGLSCSWSYYRRPFYSLLQLNSNLPFKTLIKNPLSERLLPLPTPISN